MRVARPSLIDVIGNRTSGLSIKPIRQSQYLIGDGLGSANSRRGNAADTVHEAVAQPDFYRGVGDLPADIWRSWMGNDLPLADVPLVELAELADVPAPLHRGFVDIVDALHGTNSWETGLTLERLGLAGLGVPEISDTRKPARGPRLGRLGVGHPVQQGQTPHLAGAAFVVEAGCRMHRGAVVPGDDIARLPAPLHGEIRSGDVGQQVADD